MMAELKAEYLKLRTVRSSYVIILVVLALIALICGYGYGYKGDATQLTDPHMLRDILLGLMPTVGQFAAIVAVLQLTHEYRYNTILHTLTSTNNRVKVLAAKWFITIGYVVALSLLAMVVGVGATLLGAAIQGAEVSPQSLDALNLLGRSLLFGIGYASLGLLIAVFIRNQAASIVTVLMWPLLAESLAFLLLKENVKYLPFSALNEMLNLGPEGLGFGTALLVSSGYLLVGAAAAIVLFYRRDAN